MKKISFHSLFVLGRPAAACILAAFSACVTLPSSRRVSPAEMPIQSVATPGGTPVGLRAYESGDRLLVTGGVDRTLGFEVATAAHVDVRLIGADGRLVAEARDAIRPAHPKQSRARHERYPFAVGFPKEEARNATRILVLYHSAVHES